ncbi:MAG: polyprenyl synthetase family protein [Syntrophomonadaceae bacterium]|jgi:heptaprenyl diphosphate synthase|nr:polyprenyl synthetase family protein [Syntrophomonadaceae bacterium]
MENFSLFASVADDLAAVEEKLKAYTCSSLEIMNRASLQLIEAGGKRLRPAFTLLTAKMYKEDLRDVIPLAAALEMIHMATLVHDDVIDNSLTRRGQATVKNIWGNRFSIYLGNHMFARSLSIIAGYNRGDLLEVLADASMKICEGEIIQMFGWYNLNLGMKNYLQRIQRKTAVLLSVSCALGAMLCDISEGQIVLHKKFGYYLGMAYQVIDDILDFVADEKILGKPSGSDIRQGVITLPAIYALRRGENKEELACWLSSPEKCRERVNDIIGAVLDSGGIDYAYGVARAFCERAMRQLDKMPPGAPKEEFMKITEFVINRNF